LPEFSAVWAYTPSMADEEWPEPPLGYTHWRDHALFTDAAVSEVEWEEVRGEMPEAG
jgi:hypothetical protein